MVIFVTAQKYLESCTTLEDKIAKMDLIIIALEDAALRAASGGDVSEYLIDNGQTKIQTTYRNATDIYRAIQGFEIIKQRYINRITGRVTHLVDSKNFPSQNNFGNGH